MIGGRDQLGVEGDAVSEDEGVVQLDALDAELVQKVVAFGRRQIVDVDSFSSSWMNCSRGPEGYTQGRRGEFGFGGIEEALGFGDLRVELFEERAELVGDFRGERGEAGRARCQCRQRSRVQGRNRRRRAG